MGAVIPADVFADGPLGLGWLRPEAFFGISDLDPLVHGLFWSMLLNTGAFFVISIVTFPNPLERLQGAQFVNVFDQAEATPTWTKSDANAEDLLIMSQRIIGASQAQELFTEAALAQGKQGYLPDVTPDFVARLERVLAGSVGAATAHAMVERMTQGASLSVEDLIAVADEAAQIMEYSSQLEAKSAEQDRTARALREANTKLQALSVQKDAFLSQISHELRTPMTSIRSFSEILRDMEMDSDEKARHAGIIHDEALRLTRLLDDLLDLSVLENGTVTLHTQTGDLSDVLDRALRAAGVQASGMQVRRQKSREAVMLTADLDRLCQVFINIISNAAKYCDAATPVLTINVHQVGPATVVDFVDNGSGISEQNQEVIFEKFSRLADHARAGGAGLGLAICREIMVRLGGGVTYLPGQGGAAFRVTLPIPDAVAAQ